MTGVQTCALPISLGTFWVDLPDSDPTFQDSNGMSVDLAMRDFLRPSTRTYKEAQRIMGWGN